MRIGVRVVVVDPGTGPCRAKYVIDHNLRVELHDLDTGAGVGIEVLGAKDLVQPHNDQSRESHNHHQHQRYPCAPDKAPHSSPPSGCCERSVRVTYSPDTCHDPGGTEELRSALRRFAAFGDWLAARLVPRRIASSARIRGQTCLQSPSSGAARSSAQLM